MQLFATTNDSPLMLHQPMPAEPSFQLKSMTVPRRVGGKIKERPQLSNRLIADKRVASPAQPATTPISPQSATYGSRRQKVQAVAQLKHHNAGQTDRMMRLCMRAETRLVSSRIGFGESDAGKQSFYGIFSAGLFCRLISCSCQD